MKGAIFSSTRYGSAAEDAKSIRVATGLPAINVKDRKSDLPEYDFRVLGSPILCYKLIIDKWIKSQWDTLIQKSIIFFLVSGANAGEKLDSWINESLPQELISKIKNVALRGRQIPKQI